MTNPFEIISYWLSKQSLTATEKRHMKQTLLSYVSAHPVKTGLMSPFVFRFASIAMASLLVVLGGGIGITSASMKSLPNQSLYPLKLWIEEFQSNRKSDPADQIAFETKRIEERFREAAALANKQALNESTAGMVESGLNHSQSKIKLLASNLEKTQPALALEAANTLESTISSSGKLLARIEQTSGQNVASIVLAAEVSTKQLALERVSLEKLVALQPNEVTKEIVLKRFAELEKIIQIPDNSSLNAASTMAMTVTSSEPVNDAPEDPMVELMIEIKTKIDGEEYSEALVLIKKVDQLLKEAEQTKKLEDEYDLPILPEPLPVEPTEVVPVEDEEVITDPNQVEILVPEGEVQKIPSPLEQSQINRNSEELPVSNNKSLRKAV